MKWQAQFSTAHKPREQNTGLQFWNNTEMKPALIVMSLRAALIKWSIDLKIATKKKKKVEVQNVNLEWKREKYSHEKNN